MTKKSDEVYALCEKFIQDQRIYCAECVYTSDRVIENAYDFIYSICEIVGYVEDEDYD